MFHFPEKGSTPSRDFLDFWLPLPDGHVMLGKDYIKTVERGGEVSRTALSTEKEWRDALKANFGITL